MCFSPVFPRGGFPTALLAYGLVIRVRVMNDFRSCYKLPKNIISGLKWTITYGAGACCARTVLL